MCFSLVWLVQLLVWLVIIGAIFAIIKLLLPFVAVQIGAPGAIIIKVVTIVLWAVILIFVIYFCAQMIECLLNMGSGNLLSLPSVRH